MSTTKFTVGQTVTSREYDGEYHVYESYDTYAVLRDSEGETHIIPQSMAQTFDIKTEKE